MTHSADSKGRGYELKPRRKSGVWKWVRRLATFAVVVVLLLVVAHAIWGWHETGKFNEMIAGYRAADEPVTAADFATKSVPDDQNGAVVLRKAAQSIDTESEVWHAYEEADSNIAHPMTDAEVKAFRKVVLANASVLDAPAVAARLPQIEWNVVLVSPLLENMQLKFLGEQRQLARVLSADAMLAQHDGDAARALRRAREIMQISQSVNRQPSLLCHLVSIGIANMACDTAVRTAQMPQVGSGLKSEEFAATIANLLDTDHLKEARRCMWIGERMFVIDTMEAFANGRLQLDSLTSSSTEGTSIAQAGWRYLLRPLAMHDGRWMANQLTLASRASDAPNLPAYFAKWPQPSGKSELGLWHLFTHILMPSLRRPMEHDFKTIAARRMAAVALACRLYSLDHDGKLPATLTDLVPKYLPSVPADAMTNEQPLIYNRDAAIVYSVGPNLKDDGGREAPPDSFRQKDREAVDEVVHLNRPPRPPAADDNLDPESVPESGGGLPEVGPIAPEK